MILIAILARLLEKTSTIAMEPMGVLMLLVQQLPLLLLVVARNTGCGRQGSMAARLLVSEARKAFMVLLLRSWRYCWWRRNIIETLALTQVSVRLGQSVMVTEAEYPLLLVHF